MRILVAFGTRPEIIKLGPVCLELSRKPGVELHVFWTGQHVELAAGLLDLFEINVTHTGSDIMRESGLAGKYSLMCQQIERFLKTAHYDWIVVQGDTATAAAAATAGFLNHVPVAHVEAGLRTDNMHSPWPEEFNRRMIALATTLHFAPTKEARDNLLAEGIAPEKVLTVGNTVVDALLYTRKKNGLNYRPLDADISALPKDKKLILATLHRRENIGEPIRNVLRALRELGRDGDKLIALPVHLNPDVRTTVLEYLGDMPNVRLLKPLQYPDFVYLLSQAWTVVSDSGGVQEEAPTFGLQILITRDTTERPEVIEAGFGRLVGSDFNAIVDGVRNLTASDHIQLLHKANPFGLGDSAAQIAHHLTASSELSLIAA
ncbi:non-hydrolyzing UDP-N-acetylglucosamine 2-epimerase [Microvirga pakistanensis]|uniref:non-hydrolyzing UDP-N-acetylglucosamine 2-epimerase n=1 Tax=Microvirga pakistanensis TaxID=1682650 RepID=UPI001069D2EE|nr:UDP-N-acetylglucosamine 2-epimerase (non-hydrolyzing) [Microvirga pakistanensis]